jgi:hypothetical protein
MPRSTPRRWEVATSPKAAWTRIALINTCPLLSDRDVARIAAAIQQQADQHVIPVWGLAPIRVITLPHPRSIRGRFPSSCSTVRRPGTNPLGFRTSGEPRYARVLVRPIGALSYPFSVSPQSHLLVRSCPGTETVLWGPSGPPSWRRTSWRHQASRTAQRRTPRLMRLR